MVREAYPFLIVEDGGVLGLPPRLLRRDEVKLVFLGSGEVAWPVLVGSLEYALANIVCAALELDAVA